MMAAFLSLVDSKAKTKLNPLLAPQNNALAASPPPLTPQTYSIYRIDFRSMTKY
jgi:hypothetical protein